MSYELIQKPMKTYVMLLRIFIPPSQLLHIKVLYIDVNMHDASFCLYHQILNIFITRTSR